MREAGEVRGEAELGKMNGECGIVGGVTETSTRRPSRRNSGTGTAVYGGPVPWVQIGRLVCFVYLLDLVQLISLMQTNKTNQINESD